MLSWCSVVNVEVMLSSVGSFLQDLSKSIIVTFLELICLAWPMNFVASSAHPSPSSFFGLANSSDDLFPWFMWAYIAHLDLQLGLIRVQLRPNLLYVPLVLTTIYQSKFKTKILCLFEDRKRGKFSVNYLVLICYRI